MHRLFGVLTLATVLGHVSRSQENLVPNPGFELDMAVEMDSDGKPVKWGTHIGKGKADFAIVGVRPYSGERCAHVRAHAPNPSGYWVSPRIPVKGGRFYRLTLWYRTEGVEVSSRGVSISLNFRTAAHEWRSAGAEYGDPFTNPWTRIESVGAAAADAAYVNIVVGLADSAGDLWIDDLSLVETDEVRSDIADTDAILARPFPQYWLPDRTIGLIQGEVQPLLFLVQNRTKREVSDPCIGLLLPDGIRVVGGDAGVGPPRVGEAVERGGRTFVRWLSPIEASARQRTVFDYYHGSLVALRAECPPGRYPVCTFFASDEEEQAPQETVIEVLPPLPDAPALRRTHIGFLLPDAVRAGPASLGFADMYARTGMNMIMYGRVPSTPRELGERFKSRGILRHLLLGGTGIVYNCAYGNRDPGIAALSDQGQPNLGGLCPTYTARRGEHFEKSPLESHIGQLVRADQIDGIAINWEPPGPFLGTKYCWCTRCLDAFAEQSDIPRADLDRLGPSGVSEEHGTEWLRFRARLEGLIAKAYYDKAVELTREVGREIMFVPLTAPTRFEVPHPTQADIDAHIAAGDVEHPYYYREYVHAYGPFTYAYYDVITRRWRGHHSVTLRRALEAGQFASAQVDVEPARPVWLGIEGIQKGSASTLCWATTPDQMEMEIVGALAQGCRGVYVYTGRGMDGFFYAAAARAVRRAALLEEFVDSPLREGSLSFESDLPGMTPEAIGNRFAFGRLFKDGERLLLVVCGLDFTRALPFRLKIVAALSEGTYRASDSVTGDRLGERDSWSAEELRQGVTIPLRPGQVSTYLLEPAGRGPDGR